MSLLFCLNLYTLSGVNPQEEKRDDLFVNMNILSSLNPSHSWIIKAYNLQTIKKLLQPYIIWGNGNHIVVSLGSYVHFIIYWIYFRHNQGIPNAIPDINISCNTWPTDFRFKMLSLINLKCNSLSKQTMKHHPSVSLTQVLFGEIYLKRGSRLGRFT
mgnify:CR=1 FL=1